MSLACINPVVQLELESGNLPRACAFYTGLLGWRTERVAVAGSRDYAVRDPEGNLWSFGTYRPA